MAKRHLTQYDSDGNKIPIYLEANEVDMNGRPLDEVIGEGVYDPQYVHTDNNYTTAEKNKLAGLRNYDDTDVQTAIRNINDAIDRLTGTSDTTEIIDTMNEVIDFLSGLDNTDSLANELVSIRQQLANKLNAGDAYNKQEVDDLLDVKQDIINDLVTIRNGARLGATAVQTETDPTVPSWAKQPRKPTYTAAEVGALPANTTIPQGTVTAVKVNDGQPVYPNSSGVVSLTISTSGAQVQPDWNETNTESPAYIQNKPDVANAISVNQHSYVMNNNHAFVIPDYYTKDEVDDKVANAVEGLGGGSVESVTINGTNHTPTNGVVDLGTIVGQQGPAGNTYLVDENFDPVSMIINGLDESDGTVALSARQGKILKQAINTVQANLQAVVGALANMAFTSAKPTLTPIDWTGGTFYATINKNLTGCNATDNTTNGQIAEGSTYIAYLTLQTNYIIKTISVTNGKGQAVTYSLDGNTLTIENVVGTINISILAEEHIVRHVTNRLLNMTSSNSDTSIEQGESYSAQLSVDSGCTANGDVRVKIGNSYAYNEYDVSQGVENTSGITYENGLLTIPAAAITGDIEIIATAYTGVVKITTTGATTLKYKGGVTFDLVEGLNEVALQDGKSWFFITDKTVVTDIDFGGILFNGDYNRTLQGFTNLSSVRNFVVGGGISSIHDWFNGCSSLSIIDLSYCDVSKCTVLNTLFTGSAIQRVDMSMLVFENAVNLSSAFQNTTSLTYIDIRTITNVSNVDRMFSYNSGTAPQCNVYIGDFNASSISTATNVFLNGNVNLHCLSSTPPLIGNTNWLTSGSGLAHIYVPDEAAVTAYSGATGWSAKASIIEVEPTNN